MLLAVVEKLPLDEDQKVLGNILGVLCRLIRETDHAGWYEKHSTVGVMFTEIGGDRDASLKTITERINDALRSKLTLDQFNRIRVSFHVFPDDWNQGDGQRPSHPWLYPDVADRDDARKPSHLIKRATDIVGSIMGLVILSPVFLIIAIAIKVTSKGPVFFRQRRIGRHGIPFLLLKFRSMHADSNSDAHREYVQQLIAGVAQKQSSNGDGQEVYKLTSDERVTSVGAFLRRTSLDELPQLLNVLTGEMSLVGPRPPIDYEVERYDSWHRRRLIEAKPGITGLWQVAGRNRIAFDDMVRLDVKYAQSWSLWLDFKILLRTPKAVIEGAH